ncbi:MAG: hypothetical protein RPU14_14300, partial [Candidatus Sedimenticola sp. (ex Thyasira tokunagai)]
MAALQLLGIEQLFLVVVPCPAPPQTHTSPRQTAVSRIMTEFSFHFASPWWLGLLVLILPVGIWL